MHNRMLIFWAWVFVLSDTLNGKLKMFKTFFLLPHVVVNGFIAKFKITLRSSLLFLSEEAGDSDWRIILALMIL